VAVPRTVRTLKSWTEPLSLSDLQIGDLVFFDTTGPLAHVGIYLGEGRFIHAASDGAKTE
jgi:probable lipoprotein NlpC